ncbi:SRPBCC family protein [Nocardioides sp. cx-173]|uniref:SRPBCC family protein n=1 Tax=Nocardioides sp. cx-173 TaxID=2898796 RepID=UPI001E5E4B76|nr:SRPBCC family protein [Nocardioides sp. cx-173]MCD4524161.1 SRPBCC family protein [Nocardioides sp. cx-173]UGB41556.1 SRPBCC family protein [Nocardioides sp. cx-173]
MAVHLPVPAEVAFDYLVDPVHRAQWQSSLTRVEEVSGPVAVGQRWVDVTAPGLRPRMETVVLERPHRWTERGTWRSWSAELTLEFAPAPGGCVVEPTMRLAARGPAALGARALGRLAPHAVRADLRRAGRILRKSSTDIA